MIHTQSFIRNTNMGIANIKKYAKFSMTVPAQFFEWKRDCGKEFMCLEWKCATKIKNRLQTVLVVFIE